MRTEDIFKYIDESEYNNAKLKMTDGQDRVLFENNNIKITLKKRGKKFYTFIDQYGDKPINTALNEIIKLI